MSAVLSKFEARAEAIKLLNTMVEADRGAMTALVKARVACNQAMADHPTVQVGKRESEPGPDDCVYRVGMLGVLNGLFGVQKGGDRDGWGFIAAEFEVVCPKCGPADGKAEARCPRCDSKLELGDLKRFRDLAKGKQ